MVAAFWPSASHSAAHACHALSLASQASWSFACFFCKRSCSSTARASSSFRPMIRSSSSASCTEYASLTAANSSFLHRSSSSTVSNSRDRLLLSLRPQISFARSSARARLCSSISASNWRLRVISRADAFFAASTSVISARVRTCLSTRSLCAMTMCSPRSALHAVKESVSVCTSWRREACCTRRSSHSSCSFAQTSLACCSSKVALAFSLFSASIVCARFAHLRSIAAISCCDVSTSSAASKASRRYRHASAFASATWSSRGVLFLGRRLWSPAPSGETSPRALSDHGGPHQLTRPISRPAHREFS
mmetsp:Transcript_15850/g.43383  ORF Transcript_15850/g.43383 Transcript_15850/m.43383 type:complete len:307 (+) Transcript_15850:491-1411(+)